MTARKYALVKLGPGDWLCPSNDGEWIWRFQEYDEDGTLEVGDGEGGWRTIRGRVWAAYRMRLARFQELAEYVESADDTRMEWEVYAHALRTRREAIEEMEATQ